MIEIPLSKLINDVPVGYLTDKLWITKGGKVLPLMLNEYADYELENNPVDEAINLAYEDYERLTYDYFATLPKIDDRQPTAIKKHLAGKHDQSTHAGNRLSVETPSFSDVEAAAISTYSGAAALQINAHLRGQSKRGQIASVFDLRQDQIDDAVKNLDSAIDKSVLADKVTMEREIPMSSLKGGLFQGTVGKTISDKGYLSMKRGTSNVPPRRDFLKLKLVAPAGTKALDLSFINPNAMGEIVFPRDTKIRITDYFPSSQTVRGEIVG